MIKSMPTGCTTAVRARMRGRPFRCTLWISGRLIWPVLPLLLSALVMPVASAAGGQRDVRFGVLGLFHPTELELDQASGQVIIVAEAEDSVTSAFVLNGEHGHCQLL